MSIDPNPLPFAAMKDVVHAIVKADDDQLRLDKWLRRYYPGLSFGDVQRLIRTGQVRVDGKRAKANMRLSEGQDIRVPPLSESAEKPAARRIGKEDEQFIRSLIIYEDDEVVVLNKPSGIAVQGGSKIGKHIDGLLPALADEEGNRPRLVHRLDKETSGVLLLAKTAQAAKKLGDVFKTRRAQKEYWAFLLPAPMEEDGVIRAPLAKIRDESGDRIMSDEEEGKDAFTDFAVIERVGKKAAWVAFWPRTGRMHQIRVHASLIGCPILGDDKYQGAENLSVDEDAPRQKLHLHARRLQISRRDSGLKQDIDIFAPLPPHMLETWRYFGMDPEQDCSGRRHAT